MIAFESARNCGSDDLLWVHCKRLVGIVILLEDLSVVPMIVMSSKIVPYLTQKLDECGFGKRQPQVLWFSLQI